jgi:prephenate dehydrogenase
MNQREARIVGAGLIGTSVALRLRECGWRVSISDLDSTNNGIANDLLRNPAEDSSELFIPTLVVIATPPNEVIPSLKAEFETNPSAVFIDVASTKTKLQLEVNEISGLKERFIGTHPIAGREVHGPQSARSDLFDGRAWIVTAGAEVNQEAIAQVEDFIRVMGATPYRMSPSEHDFLLARVSHLPQILSTALASSIDQVGSAIDLSGQGLRDMLRLAASDGSLWSEILLSNPQEVINSLKNFHAEVDEIEDALTKGSATKLVAIFARANQVQARLSGKHGARPREYSYLNVIIEDKPGQLGALFNECAAISANVEDLSLEHSPRQESGLIRLALSKDDAVRLYSHLTQSGWTVYLQ